MHQPMHQLVADLRRNHFTVTSATKEFGSLEPILKIITPDAEHTMLIWERDYFAAPEAMTVRIRGQLRVLGYST